MNIDSNGYQMVVDVHGAGPALLLVHGLGGTSNFWAPVVAALAPTMRVIVPDLPCAGRSALDPAVSLASLARDLLALLDALGVESAHVAGHSMGSIVCQHLVALAPARVRCPVLLIAGDDDTTAPPTSVAALAASLPDAKVEMIAHCGHWTAVEKPAEVQAALRCFYQIATHE